MVALIVSSSVATAGTLAFVMGPIADDFPPITPAMVVVVVAVVVDVAVSELLMLLSKHVLLTKKTNKD